MKLKIWVWAVFVVFLMALSDLKFKSSSVSKEAAQLELLPAEVGAFHRDAEHWKILRPDDSIEEGAMYRGEQHPDVRIQLDFYRQYDKEHNGMLCYVGQGEELMWQRQVVLNANDSNVVIALGLTRFEHQLRLIAATECYADGCQEMPFSDQWGIQVPHSARIHRAQKMTALAQRIGIGIVPMSMVLTMSFEEDEREKAEEKMLSAMNQFIASFDFSQPIKLARLQSEQ
jgi:hypothetical protein